MFNNDYVMRMIEQFVRAVAKIIGLRESGEKEEAYILLQDTLKGALGVNADTVDALDYDAFLAVMGTGGALTAERYVLLSELLRLKAEFALDEGREAAAVDLYDKALCLYLAALDDEPAWVEVPLHTERVERLLTALGGYRLSDRAYTELARWHERAGRFGRAEDALYRHMDLTGRDVASVRETLAFYDRLLRLGPEALEKGNLPLDEVRSARDELSGSLSNP